MEHGELLLRHHKGNGLADEIAKRALERHPVPEPRLAGAVFGDVCDVSAALKLAGTLLPLWEPVPFASLQRVGPPLTADQQQAPSQAHKWARSGDGHQCSKCYLFVRTWAARRRRSHHKCPDYAAAFGLCSAAPSAAMDKARRQAQAAQRRLKALQLIRNIQDGESSPGTRT